MNIFITGLNRFIARRLSLWLSDRGHSITGTSRSSNDRFPSIAWRLGDEIDRSVFANIDVIIHAAHDFTPGAKNTNVSGTIALEQAASASGVPRQIFISSLSTRPDAVSEYGQTKLAEEKYFLSRGHTVVRPGTVLGGLFGKLAGMMGGCLCCLSSMADAPASQ